MRSFLIRSLSVTALLAAAAACAGSAAAITPPHPPTLNQILTAADTNLPSAWVGVWSIHTVETDCTSGATFYDATLVDTLCVDQSIAPGDSTVSCNVQVDATSFHVTCSGTQDVIAGCTATFSYDVSGSVTGNSFTSTGTFNITYSGDCFGAEDSCFNITETGTRTSSDPGVCNTPTLPNTWGRLKAMYR